MNLDTIYHENCIDTLKKMPDGFVDVTVTSPPYDDIRTYEGKVGKLSDSFNGYSFDFETIAKELFRVTKEGGVVVWVVGDAVIKGSETGTSFRQALYFKECGFNIHDTMIYEKNGTSFPARRDGNRYSQIFEFMFVLSKGSPKTHNLICDKENRWAGWTSFGKCKMRNKKGELVERTMKPVPTHSARNNIWKYNTGKNYSTKDDEAFEHPAIFPEKLAEDHILTWSGEGDVVYDPFMGSGTTAKMAFLNKRKYIGSEMNEKYIDIINRRLSKLSLFVNQKDESVVETTHPEPTKPTVDETTTTDTVKNTNKISSPRFIYNGKSYFSGDLLTVGDFVYKVKSRGIIPSKVKDIINKPPVS